MKKITRTKFSSYIIIIIDRCGFFNKKHKKKEGVLKHPPKKTNLHYALKISHPYILKSTRILSLIQP